MKKEEVAELPLTDGEIYRSKNYSSISRSIIIAFISGNLSCLGVSLLDKKIAFSVIAGGISLLFFCSSFLIGLKNLFPEVAIEGGDSENDW